MAERFVSIGERIAITRRRRGMTQAQLAGQLGRSVQWLSMIERGVRRADRYSILVPIADVLGLSVSELTQHAPVESCRPDARQHDAGRAVRQALIGHTFAGTSREPIVGDDLARLREQVRCAWTFVHEARYGELGRRLPGLTNATVRADRVGVRARSLRRCLPAARRAVSGGRGDDGEAGRGGRGMGGR